MHIVFRVDASDKIGTGHVYRCLFFAHHYSKNHSISFICKKHSFHLIEKIKEKYPCYILELKKTDHVNLNPDTWLGESQLKDVQKTISVIEENKLNVDWMVIDHYAIDIQWEREIKPFVKRICVVDDFIHRPHDCDIYINQQISFPVIMNLTSKICYGNDYLMVHPQYFLFTPPIRTTVKRIHIFMGGADIHNITNDLIDLLHASHLNVEFDIVIGKANPHATQLKKKIENPAYKAFHYYEDIQFMGDILQRADLAIGAPGSSSYERVITRTPTLMICIAENQKTVIQKFIDAKTVLYCGTYQDNYKDKLMEYLQLILNTNIYKEMVMNCGNMIDLKKNKIHKLLDEGAS